MKFITKTQKKRSAVSPVIATLLLIAIAVAAAIIVYAFVTGLIGGLSNGANSNLVTATGSLVIPSGTTTGLLVITLQNTANNPITGIQVSLTSMQDSGALGVTCIGETTAAAGVSCTAVSTGLSACGATNPLLATKSIPFCNATPSPITTAAALQVGGEVSAAENVIGSGAVVLQSGSSYSMTITVDFANGGTHTQALSVTGQI